MTAEQFAYWLQGFAELHAEPPTPEQWQSVKEHLALVFTKITPPVRGIPIQPLPQYVPNWSAPLSPQFYDTTTTC